MRRDEIAGWRGRLRNARVLPVFMRAICASSFCFGLGIDHRADMGGGICGIADLQLARGARDHLDHAVGDVVLHEQQPQRRAALAGGAERRSHDVVGDLFGQRGRIDDHGVDAAGLRDQRHDRAVLGGERAVDRARHFGRAGEDDAGDVGMRDQRGADLAVALHEMQRGGRHAGFMQQLHGFRRDQRRLLGGLRHHGIAGHQRRRDLAQKNRQRKIPRRDRNEDAAAAQSQHIAFAGRPRHRFAVAEQLSALRGVVAAEVDGLAHLRQRIVQRLAALALQQRDEMRRFAAPADRRRSPACRRARRQASGSSAKARARRGDRPHWPAPASHRSRCLPGGTVSAAIAATSAVSAARSPNSTPRELLRCG